MDSKGFRLLEKLDMFIFTALSRAQHKASKHITKTTTAWTIAYRILRLLVQVHIKTFVLLGELLRSPRKLLDLLRR